MKKINYKFLIKNISYSALFIALTFISTAFLKIPYGGGSGYFNLGDGIILFSTLFINPYVGFISATIGSMFGDLFSGYISFIPFTFVAKGLESLGVYFIYKLVKKHNNLKYLSNFIAPIFMVLTYFVSYIIMFDLNYAFVSLGFDIVQGLSGSIISIILLNIFKRNKIHLENESSR